MFRALTLAACLAGAGTADAAQIYLCRIQENGRSGWIPEVLFIGQEQGRDTATVSDPLILYFNDRTPVTARVAADNPRRITFVWSILVQARPAQSAGTMQYTATFLKANRKMLIAARPIGASGQFTGGGTCNIEQR